MLTTQRLPHCACVGCHTPQIHVEHDVTGSNQADREAARQWHWWSHVNHDLYRLVSRSPPSLISMFWLPTDGLICRVIKHAHMDDGVYQRQSGLFFFSPPDLIRQRWDKVLMRGHLCEVTELQSQNATISLVLTGPQEHDTGPLILQSVAEWSAQSFNHVRARPLAFCWAVQPDGGSSMERVVGGKSFPQHPFR